MSKLMALSAILEGYSYQNNESHQFMAMIILQLHINCYHYLYSENICDPV